jgi:hypothetical protein
MTRCDIKRVDVTRRSSRTGQVHSIGGFVGEAEYEGDLAEFFPYLRPRDGPELGGKRFGAKANLPYPCQ